LGIHGGSKDMKKSFFEGVETSLSDFKAKTTLPTPDYHDF
jgi:hypothetical protein